MRSISEVAGGERRELAQLDWDEYRPATGLNPSTLVHDQSARHLKCAYETPDVPVDQRKNRDQLYRGTAAHAMVFEPESVKNIASWTGRDRRGKAWQEFVEEHDGQLILRQVDFVRAVHASDAVRNDPVAAPYFMEGLAEQSVFAVEQGLQCKGRIDWISTSIPGTLVDLKLTARIEKRDFGRTFFNLAYHVKLACYAKWFTDVTGKEISDVKVVCVEDAPPYDVTVVPVAMCHLERGWDRAEKAIRMVREGIDTGVWPGVAGGTEYELDVPSYVEHTEADLVEWGT